MELRLGRVRVLVGIRFRECWVWRVKVRMLSVRAGLSVRVRT